MTNIAIDEFITRTPAYITSDLANTRIHVEYRDADNYKIHAEIFVTGRLTGEQADAMRRNLVDSMFFVPTAIGLPHLLERAGQDESEADHPYHTIGELEPADSPRADDLIPHGALSTADGFAAAFSKADWLSAV